MAVWTSGSSEPVSPGLGASHACRAAGAPPGAGAGLGPDSRGSQEHGRPLVTAPHMGRADSGPPGLPPCWKPPEAQDPLPCPWAPPCTPQLLPEHGLGSVRVPTRRQPLEGRRQHRRAPASPGALPPAQPGPGFCWRAHSRVGHRRLTLDSGRGWLQGNVGGASSSRASPPRWAGRQRRDPVCLLCQLGSSKAFSAPAQPRQI